MVAAVAFAVVVSLLNRFELLTVALAAAVLGAAVSQLKPQEVIRRMVPVNLLMLLLVGLMPLTTPGEPLVSLGPVDYTLEGLLLAGRIAVKANAIVLVLVVLLSALDVTTMGHALDHLRVPEKLTHLLLFTVRYLDVLKREYLRLAASMKLRAFRPGLNRHTYRTYGYLVGVLLVRSLDRSERIIAAMKCRGFRGHFYLLDHFSFSRADAWFAATSIVFLFGLGLSEWLCTIR